MKHRASRRFWDCYNNLPQQVQKLADSSYELLKSNEQHPSLQLKKVGRLWSVRGGLHYRALEVEDASDLVWFWIGHHSEYDRLIAGR